SSDLITQWEPGRLQDFWSSFQSSSPDGMPAAAASTLSPRNVLQLAKKQLSSKRRNLKLKKTKPRLSVELDFLSLSLLKRGFKHVSHREGFTASTSHESVSSRVVRIAFTGRKDRHFQHNFRRITGRF